MERAADNGYLSIILLNNKVVSTQFVKIAFGYPEKTPVRDIIMSRLFQRASNKSKGIPNWYPPSHYVIKTKSLPYPYESGCFDYRREGGSNDIEWINACFINKTLEASNQLALTAVILKPLNYTFLHYNSSFYSKISTLKDLCSTECRKPPCVDTQVVTFTDNGYYDDQVHYYNYSFFIHHTIPVLPFVNISLRATQTMVEFFLSAASTISTWSGLSILGLNPVILLNRVFIHRSKLMTLKQEQDDNRFATSRKRLQKVNLLLASRDSQLQSLQRDFHRLERLINTLINSRLV